jgi:hypothetical protein
LWPLGNRHYGDFQTVFGAKADLIARHANDAGVPGPKHFDARPAAQTELLQPVNVVRMPLNPADLAVLTGQHLTQGNRTVLHDQCSIGISRGRIKDGTMLATLAVIVVGLFTLNRPSSDHTINCASQNIRYLSVNSAFTPHSCLHKGFGLIHFTFLPPWPTNDRKRAVA